MLFKSITAKLCWKCKKHIRVIWMTVASKCFTLFQPSKICVYTILFISEKSGLMVLMMIMINGYFLQVLTICQAPHEAYHIPTLGYFLQKFCEISFHILTFINRLFATKWLTWNHPIRWHRGSNQVGLFWSLTSSVWSCLSLLQPPAQAK